MTVTVFTNPNNPQCEATEQELSKLECGTWRSI